MLMTQPFQKTLLHNPKKTLGICWRSLLDVKGCYSYKYATTSSTSLLEKLWGIQNQCNPHMETALCCILAREDITNSIYNQATDYWLRQNKGHCPLFLSQQPSKLCLGCFRTTKRRYNLPMCSTRGWALTIPGGGEWQLPSLPKWVAFMRVGRVFEVLCIKVPDLRDVQSENEEEEEGRVSTIEIKSSKGKISLPYEHFPIIINATHKQGNSKESTGESCVNPSRERVSNLRTLLWRSCWWRNLLWYLWHGFIMDAPV